MEKHSCKVRLENCLCENIVFVVATSIQGLVEFKRLDKDYESKIYFEDSVVDGLVDGFSLTNYIFRILTAPCTPD